MMRLSQQHASLHSKGNTSHNAKGISRVKGQHTRIKFCSNIAGPVHGHIEAQHFIPRGQYLVMRCVRPAAAFFTYHANIYHQLITK